MKMLGILGGMSWESTLVYYRLLNQGVAQRKGGLHSAPLVLHSVDFAQIAALQRAGDWDEAARQLGAAGRALKQAGAQALLIATNTMHLVAEPVRQAAGLPLLHIADATGAALRAAGHRRVGLLGTRFTMEQRFLRDHLQQDYGIEAVAPDAADRECVHHVIFDELCRGTVSAASREAYLGVIARLAERGCTAVALGCTEIGLLLPPGTPAAVPLFDTTVLHAEAALAWMCDDDAAATNAPGARATSKSLTEEKVTS
ncbi:aspartate/glutamate racemase family protein [Ideonella sp. BN130291]|uniref:aspartate/glutamate racemase family protein n=1 Tax=Ideonella sp. BN130291 TaxID=3112940 RepID=UPI002E26C9F9|nr:aspartate/glutamate racemase family protein [Ideonella sp. BN130291]